MNTKSRLNATRVHIRALKELRREMASQYQSDSSFIDTLLLEQLRLLDLLIDKVDTRQTQLNRELVGDKG